MSTTTATVINPTPPKLQTGAQIRAGRALLGWRRKDLAAAAGLHPNAIAYWERRERMSRGREEIGPARIRKALFRAGVVTVSTPAPGVCILPGILREVPAARARASMPVPDAASQMIDAADAPPPINASDAPRSNGGDAAEFVAPPADQPNCIGDTC